jgi:hypothetical protein
MRTATVILLILMLVACAPTQEEIAWDADPEVLIVRLYSPHTTAGLSGAYDRRYYVPEVQVWGDGRIIWVAREGGARQVFEGQLSPEQMDALLTRIVEAGFFEWEEKYATLGGNSMPPMHLQVNLAERAKEIQEHGGAPEAYYDLEAFLLAGAGAQGQAYTPERGYLSAQPFMPAEPGVEFPTWPEDAIPLAELEEGCYIFGDALTLAWEWVNRHPRGPVYVRSGDQVYHVMVQIPDVSYFEPPIQGPDCT